MRNVLIGRGLLLIAGCLAGAATIALTRAQTPAPKVLPPHLPAVDLRTPPASMPPTQLVPVKGSTDSSRPAAELKSRPAAAYDRFRNLDALPEMTRQMVMSTMLGMEWLQRYNQPTGLFLHGYLPAVNLPMEGDNFLHQAMAAFVLARAARFTGDERLAARAQQTLLTLLTTTTTEPANANVRRPAQPSIVCNRLAAAGFLVMAIHELPDAAVDLLTKSEELVAFIRQCQLEDGSLRYVDAPAENASDPEGINRYPGPAVCGLAMSHRARPSTAKADSLRRAVAYYRKVFKDRPNPDLVPWLTAACVDGYAATKENPFAEFAIEMNDWLCALQYAESPDPRRPLWRGGFRSFAKGKVETVPPGIEAALYAQSLADACRLVRIMPNADLQRHDRYRTALLRALQFLTTLQFTDANTLHISANYRSMLVGGFHPTHLDGNLRIDQCAAGISAFIQFLTSGADRSQ